jgi:PEP-CTERM motif
MTRFGKFKKATALALALSAGFGVSSSAHAGLVATAVLEVTNILFKSTAGAQLDISNFGGAIVQDSGTNTAALTGFATVSNTGIAFGGGPMDILQACVGGPCPAQNNFAHTLPPPPVGTQLVRADSNLGGSPVTGLPATLGGNARTVAEVLLNGSAVGNGDSDLGLNTLFTFSLAQAQAIRLSFDADLYLRAFLSPDSKIGSSAAATSKLTFSLVDLSSGLEIFSWAPNGAAGGITGGTELFDGANLNTSRTALLPGLNLAADQAGSQFFQADTDVIAAGAYQFVISHVVGADGTLLIPEPGTILLAGLGLVGVAFSRRRSIQAV